MSIINLGLIKRWEIRTLNELPGVMLLSIVSGLLGGIIIGFGQQKALSRTLSINSTDWWWKTLIGMG
ncbi:MAG: hypothetical protein DRI46_00010 [Chloroflexi bacterium]|nr:MAG: hypothetical protein DRI46_00010 [Chloroflexota bacterium]